jgi:hypothetical protein
MLHTTAGTGGNKAQQKKYPVLMHTICLAYLDHCSKWGPLV